MVSSMDRRYIEYCKQTGSIEQWACVASLNRGLVVEVTFEERLEGERK